MLTWNFSNFVTRGGQEQESGALLFHDYSLPCWTKVTVDFCRLTDFSEQEPIAQNWIKLLHIQFKWTLFHQKHLF